MAQRVMVVCAKCKKPVERLDWWDDPASDARFFRAYCHGDTDICKVKMVDFLQYGYTLMAAEAFKPKELEHGSGK